MNKAQFGTIAGRRLEIADITFTASSYSGLPGILPYLFHPGNTVGLYLGIGLRATVFFFQVIA